MSKQLNIGFPSATVLNVYKFVLNIGGKNTLPLSEHQGTLNLYSLLHNVTRIFINIHFLPHYSNVYNRTKVKQENIYIRFRYRCIINSSPFNIRFIYRCIINSSPPPPFNIKVYAFKVSYVKPMSECEWVLCASRFQQPLGHHESHAMYTLQSTTVTLYCICIYPVYIVPHF